MKNAFIVYAPPDRRLAVRLWDELRWNGLDIGIDLQEVPLHLERSAVLEDIIFRCEMLIVLVNETLPSEMRRLCALAIEQELNVIALQQPRTELPKALRARQTIVFSDYERGFKHLLRLLPAHLIDKSPNENQILGNLHHTNPNVRRTNLFLVGKDRLHFALHPTICKLLSDTDPQVRAAAAWALDQLSNVEAAPALIHALYDTAYDVRSNAGWALVNIGRRRDSPASRIVTHKVIDVLRDSSRYDARKMAYQVLLRLGGKDALDAIDKYWNES